MPELTFLADAPTAVTPPAADVDRPTSRIQLAKPGRFKHPLYGRFHIDTGIFASFERNFQAVSGGQLPIDFDHAPDKGGSTEAAGWITQLHTEPAGLFATVQWTSKGAEAIKDGRYRFISPTWKLAYTSDDGTRRGPTLFGAALTNRPFFERMAVVSLSQHPEALTFAQPAESEPDVDDPAEFAAPGEPNLSEPDPARLNAAARRHLASKGHAMPDGSYPIRHKGDLAKAIKAVGRGCSAHEQIRRHIAKRARALGAGDQLPDHWTGDGAASHDRAGLSDLADCFADPWDPDEFNWVSDVGGLPQYIKRIAKHLGEKGRPQSQAIATAVNAAKKMCSTGDLNWPGLQHVNPGSRAEACAAIKDWEAKKARARAHGGLSDSRRRMPGINDIAQVFSLDADSDDLLVAVRDAHGDLATFAQALGLHADTSRDQVVAKARELAAKAAEAPKTGERIDSETYAKLVADAAAGVQARDELSVMRFDRAYNAALDTGRVVPAERDYLHEGFKRDPDATEKYLAERQPIVNVKPRGATGEAADAPEGVDPGSHDLDRRVKAYMAEHKIDDYTQAYEAVAGAIAV